MKVCICGSRLIKKYSDVGPVLDKHFASLPISEVVSGGCKGPDLLAETWAVKNNIPIKRFNAEWDKYGISAGFKRNVLMADYADEIIAFMPENIDTKGTSHTIRLAQKQGKKVYVYRVRMVS